MDCLKMPKIPQDITAALAIRGFAIQDWTGTPNYKNRKGKVFAIVDLRTGRSIATYATIGQVRSWAKRQNWPSI